MSKKVEIEKIERGMYFPTPIWFAKLGGITDLNNALLQGIANLQKADQTGRQRSNVGGWQSNDNLHKLPEFRPLFIALSDVLQSVSQAYSVHPNAELFFQNAWANVNYPGTSNAPHIHASAAFSGAYYVRMAKGCGDIEFLDPRGGASMARPLYPQLRQNELTQPRVSFSPQPGDVFIFPGWLLHHVHANQSRDLRVTIAFNLGYRPKR
ncbi:MAG: TIGR02466 family protein [Myxococcota bacterium]|nr:TIGR02466 family protein [Myxococcota bacterium]